MDAKTDLTKNDLDPMETQEWLDALAAVIGADGTDRAHFLLERMIESTRLAGGHLPFKYTTAYINTIPAHLEQKSSGDAAIEWKLRAYTRWNALATVVRANRKPGEVGGRRVNHDADAQLGRAAVRGVGTDGGHRERVAIGIAVVGEELAERDVHGAVLPRGRAVIKGDGRAIHGQNGGGAGGRAGHVGNHHIVAATVGVLRRVDGEAVGRGGCLRPQGSENLCHGDRCA